MKKKEFSRICIAAQNFTKLENKKLDFRQFLSSLLFTIKDESAYLQELLDDLKKEVQEARANFGKKDKDGNLIYEPIFDEEGKKIGEIAIGLLPGQNKEYDNYIKEIDAKEKELLNEDITIDFSKVKKIKFADIPEKANENDVVTIAEFISNFMG